MNAFIDRFALWLADNYHLSTMLLVAVLVVAAFLRQPAKRLAVAKATIVAMLVIAGLMAFPGWSIVHLCRFEHDGVPPAAKVSGLPEVPAAVQVVPAERLNVAQVPGPSAPAPPARSFSMPSLRWQQIVVGCYVTGAGIVLAWSFLGALAARWLVGRAESASDSIQQLAAELATGAFPKLLVSGRVSVPVALGVVRPTIILPTDWIKVRKTDELRTILAHELAHVENGDLRWLAVGRALLVLFWAQPFYWLLRRAMRLDQESLADAAAAAITNRQKYAEQLVAWARNMPAQPRLAFPAAVGLWESPSQLRRRVALLLNDRLSILRHCSRGWRVAATAAMLAAAAGLSLVTLAPDTRSAAPDEHPAQLPKELHPLFGSGDKPSPQNATGDQAVAPTGLAGRVVDEQGQPLANVNVDAWTWYPGNETKTDAAGHFALKGFNEHEKVEVEFTKGGYCPSLFPSQPAGTPDWTIQLNSRTYLEGSVTGPDGQPAANAKVRASRGLSNDSGAVIGQVWTETKTVSDGHYRLYLEPDTYNVQVLVPDVGIARSEHVVLHFGDKIPFDIALRQGPVFRAQIVDSQTGEPVSGIRLWNWQQPGIEGASNADGIINIDNMLPGEFEFNVTAVGQDVMSRLCTAGEYARWWSPLALKPSEKLDLNGGGFNFQRNFDDLSFDVRDGMEPVSIVVEKCVTIQGHVVDPVGKPVAGATVAPAKTGSGNSITGDTRYSVRTADDGTFTMKLPASGAGQYNLVAHDGDYEQWRTWANGTNEPFQTKPGDVLQDIELKLSPPCIIRGRVVDSAGNPMPNLPVRTQSFDKRANRYYDPTTKTDAKGEFELRFVSPGDHYVQAGDYWMPPETGPKGAMQLTMADPNHPCDVVKLVVDRPLPHIDIHNVDVPATPAAPGPDGQDAKKPSGNNSSDDRPSRPKPSTLSGRITDENGQPLTGIQVKLYRFNLIDRDPHEVDTRQTDQNGRYQFDLSDRIKELFPDGKLPELGDMSSYQPLVRIVAHAPGRVTAQQPEFAARVARIGAHFEHQMPPASALRGRVTDPDGKPIAGALVSAGGELGRSLDVYSAHTDADGQYVIDDIARFDAEKYAEEQKAQAAYALKAAKDTPGVTGTFSASPPMLQVTHPDFATKSVRYDRIPGTRDAQLAPAAAITGRVIYRDTKEPAVGVLVHLMNSISEEQEKSAADQAYWFDEAGDARNSWTQAKTDAEGRFKFTNVPAKEYDLWAETDGWLNQGIGKLKTVAGQSTTAPDLIFEPGVFMHIRFVDSKHPFTVPDGQFGKVYFGLQPLHHLSRRPAYQQQAAAEPSGRYTIRALPGKAQLYCPPLWENGLPKWAQDLDPNGGGVVVDVPPDRDVNVKIPMSEIASAPAANPIHTDNDSKSDTWAK